MVQKKKETAAEPLRSDSGGLYLTATNIQSKNVQLKTTLFNLHMFLCDVSVYAHVHETLLV